MDKRVCKKNDIEQTIDEKYKFGVNSKELYDRLKYLEDDGFIYKKKYDSVWWYYKTEKGFQFMTALKNSVNRIITTGFTIKKFM